MPISQWFDDVLKVLLIKHCLELLNILNCAFIDRDQNVTIS